MINNIARNCIVLVAICVLSCQHGPVEVTGVVKSTYGGKLLFEKGNTCSPIEDSSKWKNCRMSLSYVGTSMNGCTERAELGGNCDENGMFSGTRRWSICWEGSDRGRIVYEEKYSENTLKEKRVYVKDNSRDAVNSEQVIKLGDKKIKLQCGEYLRRHEAGIGEKDPRLFDMEI
jgi:hypothetical protein